MRIVIRKGGRVVAQHELLAEEITLGRSRQCDVILADPGVSRKHARILNKEDRVLLEDLQSSAGTKIGDLSISVVQIDVGDVARIGPFKIYFEAKEAAALSELPSEPAESSDDADDTLAEMATQVGPPIELEDEPSLSARLVRIDGGDSGTEIPLDKDEVTIGRSRESDIAIDDHEVSENHAVLSKQDGGFVIKDQVESKGTFIDGVPVRERQLENHDILEIGKARFEFLEGDAHSRVERPKVVERSSAASNPRFSKAPSSGSAKRVDWRWFALAGGALGGLGIWLTRSAPPVMQPLPVSSPVAAFTLPPSTPSSAEVTDSETQRLLLFHLDKAKALVDTREYDQAGVHLDHILSKLSPGYPEALALQSRIADEQRATQEQIAVQAAKVSELIEKGDALAASDKIAEARSAYNEALRLDSSNDKIQYALKQLTESEERKKKDDEARNKSNAELKSLYTQAVTLKESGDVGSAEAVLLDVLAKKGSPYEASAQKLLDEIRAGADEEITQKLKDLDTQAEAGDPIGAFKQARKIAKQFPRREDASKLATRLETDLTAQAKKAFMEGVTYLDVVEDRPAALERFQEALRLSPDPSMEYYRKAKKKIEELKASPSAVQ